MPDALPPPPPVARVSALAPPPQAVRAILVPLPGTRDDLDALAAHAAAAGLDARPAALAAQDVARRLAGDFVLAAWTALPPPAPPSAAEGDGEGEGGRRPGRRDPDGPPPPRRLAVTAVALPRAARALAERADAARAAGAPAAPAALAFGLLAEALQGGWPGPLAGARLGYLVAPASEDPEAAPALLAQEARP